jgi:hypothetical protein
MGYAHSAIQQAVMQGKLAALDGSIACVDCGAPATNYDHRDYAKPLDVEPVCWPCNVKRGGGKNRIGGMVRVNLNPEETVAFKVWCLNHHTTATAIMTKKIRALIKREKSFSIGAQGLPASDEEPYL